MRSFFRFRWKNVGLEWRFYERIFCKVFVVVGRDEFCFFKCRGPPLNLKIFISGDAFDDSTFFYEQSKFTGWSASALLCLVAKSMRPVGIQSRFTTPLNSVLVRLCRALSLQLLSADLPSLAPSPLPEGNISSSRGDRLSDASLYTALILHGAKGTQWKCL